MTFVTIVALLLTGTAHADSPRVVLAPSGQDTLLQRLHEELGVLQIDVDTMDTGTSSEQLRTRQRDADADAAVLVGEDDNVWIWIGDEAEGQELREADPALLALATVEVLRGRLTDVPDALTPPEEAAPEPGESDPSNAASHASQLEPEPDAPSVMLRLGPGVLFGAGDLPPQLMFDIGAAFRLTSGLYFELSATPSIPGAEVGQSEVFTLWSAAVGLEAGWIWLDPADAFTVLTGAGVRALVVTYDDDKKLEARAAVMPYLHVAARHRLTGPLGARIDATLGFGLPEIELKLKGGERPTFGIPASTISIGVDLAF